MSAVIINGTPVVVQGAPGEVAHDLNTAGTHLACLLDAGDGQRIYVNPAHVTMVVEAHTKSEDELNAERARARITLA